MRLSHSQDLINIYQSWNFERLDSIKEKYIQRETHTGHLERWHSFWSPWKTRCQGEEWPPLPGGFAAARRSSGRWPTWLSKWTKNHTPFHNDLLNYNRPHHLTFLWTRGYRRGLQPCTSRSDSDRSSFPGPSNRVALLGSYKDNGTIPSFCIDEGSKRMIRPFMWLSAPAHIW